VAGQQPVGQQAGVGGTGANPGQQQPQFDFSSLFGS